MWEQLPLSELVTQIGLLKVPDTTQIDNSHILCPISNLADPLSQRSQIMMLVPGTEFNFHSASLEVNDKINSYLIKNKKVDK